MDPAQTQRIHELFRLDEKWDELNKTHLEMIRGHMKMSFFKASTAIEFADQILRLIDFFDEREAKVFCLGTALYSNYIPYRELPGIPRKISEQARHLVDSNRTELEMIQYIAGITFNDLLEEASLVLQAIDDVKNNELRIVMLSVYIGIYLEKLRKK